jgi:Asp-tRNA(Asn)/Glu-tRNA(Gln) amidotransferase A subunit family amidase
LIDTAISAGLPAPGGWAAESVTHFASAYRDGTTTPEEVAERVIAATRESDQRDPPMRIIIEQNADDLRKQARASAERHRQGKPLSPLDGVPVAVKDELDLAGYPTKVGTSFLGIEPKHDDATVVARLRNAGALLTGKANMTEIGIVVTGMNVHNGPVRNPYDPARFTGGSSSGPAAGVAAGLCPVAVGADGGGSIRIPAALCGVVGLKPTFGRVSEHGAAPLCWSVAHVGPIAATVRDCALAYAVMAGPDPADSNSLSQPTPTLSGFHKADLADVTLGLYPEWFEDAEPEVVQACRRTLEGLKDAGCRVREVELPDLGLLRTVHTVIIVSEMATSQLHHFKDHRKDYAHDIRLNLELAGRLKATDYIHAQRHRMQLCAQFDEVMKQVDAIVTPATGCTAKPIPRKAHKTGESYLEQTDTIMRFARPANVTGLPAISFPAGYDPDGLPVGFQVMGRAYDEALLLRIAAVAEGLVERKEPRVHWRLLEAGK